MSEKIGHIALETDQRTYMTPDLLMGGPRQHDYGEHTADTIDDEIRKIIDHAFDRAVSILSERRDALESYAEKLLEVETLGADDLRVLERQSTAEPESKLG